MSYLIYILAFAVLLGVLVTIHEFGHFIVARMCNVHVQRFSVGMGPVFYKKCDKHGTEFALSAIPLGGYVSMITNKLIELEPEIKNQLTEEQLKNTFDSKPKAHRAAIMFAGPLANFLLSIVIFTGIFLNTVDPKIVPVINSVNQEIIYSNNETFKANDKILSINNVTVKEAKDINLELLSYAGYSGDLMFSVERDNSDKPINVFVGLKDFLPTSQSQADPTGSLGIKVEYFMQPIIGKVISGGSADRAGIKSNDKILEINNSKILFANDIQKKVSENPNRSLEFKLIRDGEIIYLPVNIDSQINENVT